MPERRSRCNVYLPKVPDNAVPALNEVPELGFGAFKSV